MKSMMILPKVLVILALAYALTGCSKPERCIPFADWSRAIDKDRARFEECIQPNIDCERRQKTEAGLKCKWNDCPMTGTGSESLEALSGYPDRHLVCENDCGLSILNFCIYSGRQNSTEAKKVLTGVLEALKEFE